MKQMQLLRTQFEALSGRERGMMFAALQVVILALGLVMVAEPMWMKLKQLQGSAAQIERQLPQFQAQLLDLNDRLTLDVNESNRLKLERLAEEIAQEQAELGERVVGLILPEQMPSVLAQMLGSVSGVELVSLVSNPSEPLATGSALYQHGLTLRLKGEFFGLMKVLAKMESLPQQFYWQKVDYQVESYPIAVMTLDIYTLGTEKELIRVGTRARTDFELFSGR
ncbi:hypothetical protein FCL40_01205 [Ferrimonas sediminicola]|uniref:MSHA biogenesis protein MshJ n=1 Tax=Ferrimonas sediminicola TaxID=2569538 RepID=A0A4U1BK63_9GAMM|nr:hypothetical protein [Ferrimonas sediminicola]TKB51204.1 hypothetical protein FCL40_01205 [Ferrimonas sediminicola]